MRTGLIPFLKEDEPHRVSPGQKRRKSTEDPLVYG